LRLQALQVSKIDFLNLRVDHEWNDYSKTQNETPTLTALEFPEGMPGICLQSLPSLLSTPQGEFGRLFNCAKLNP
jgi:hypothetical protein